MEEIVKISKNFAEERSHAFYGDETSLIPASELFEREDAKEALKDVEKTLNLFERLTKEFKLNSTFSQK
ncbi:MAG: hypothetical protein AB1393_10325 [Candidatus Edwardsbacteria bacterium]